MEHVAAAVAAAFLAGDWDPPAMGRRAKRALGTRRHWPTELARTVRHEYPERPADRPRELDAFICACELFVDKVAGAGPTLRIHVWMVSPTEMGPTPWPVPAIPDLTALAAWLGVTPDHDWFADRRSIERTAPAERLRHYHRRWVRKADGSSRLLEAPKRSSRTSSARSCTASWTASPPIRPPTGSVPAVPSSPARPCTRGERWSFASTSRPSSPL
jgi:hypothetical protein